MRTHRLLIVFLSLLITGCAHVAEGVYGLGLTVPKGAPPGYASFHRGLVAQQEGDFMSAQVAFCNATKLGYSGSQSYCETSTLIVAAYEMFIKKDVGFAKSLVCSVKDYGGVAQALCQKSEQGYDISSDLYQYVRAVLHVKPVQQSENRSETSDSMKVKDLVGELE